MRIVAFNLVQEDKRRDPPDRWQRLLVADQIPDLGSGLCEVSRPWPEGDEALFEPVIIARLHDLLQWRGHRKLAGLRHLASVAAIDSVS